MKTTSFRIVQRRFVTLIEMMIVMFLIALITGVVAYNYRGSLDEGKAFKTKAAIEKIRNILDLSIAEDPSVDFTGDAWKEIIRRSPLVQNPDALMRDGWGGEYSVTKEPNSHTIEITSSRLDAYERTKSNTK